jgi:hypothetical protein
MPAEVVGDLTYLLLDLPEEPEVLVVVVMVVQKHLPDLEHLEPMQRVVVEVVEHILDHQ